MVQWLGKNEIWSGKSQGISLQTKSGHPVPVNFENFLAKKSSISLQTVGFLFQN